MAARRSRPAGGLAAWRRPVRSEHSARMERGTMPETPMRAGARCLADGVLRGVVRQARTAPQTDAADCGGFGQSPASGRADANHHSAVHAVRNLHPGRVTPDAGARTGPSAAERPLVVLAAVARARPVLLSPARLGGEPRMASRAG